MTVDDLREKVIKGFTCCDGAAVHLGHCQEDCPYFGESERADECVEKLHSDAISLLKAQEPRVVTPSDFENNPDLDSCGHLNVYEEYKDGTRSGWNTISVNDARSFTDIRRFWTSRPTDKQREAVKWNE